MNLPDAEMPNLEGLSGAAQSLIRAIDLHRKGLASRAGVSTTELRTLARIAAAPGMNPKEVATALGLSTPAVTAVTNSLVARQLILRISDPHDRRRLRLILTPAGVTATEAIFEDFNSVVVSSVSGFSQEEVDTAERVITKLIEGLLQN